MKRRRSSPGFSRGPGIGVSLGALRQVPQHRAPPFPSRKPTLRHPCCWRRRAATMLPMPKQNEHGRLIAAAAKAALAPLRCKRVGQSRFWYSDEGFWTVSIEFQPSGWAKGSYLNVGANWLWYPKSGWGFSHRRHPRRRYRLHPLRKHRAIPAIDCDTAARAAQEVLRRARNIGRLRKSTVAFCRARRAMVYPPITRRSLPGCSAT